MSLDADEILATLDTNVLASGALKLGDPASAPGQVLDRWTEGEFVLVCSAPILDKLARTLNNRYFRRHLTDEQVANMVQLLRDESQMVELSACVRGVASHPADDLILATAVSAGAQFLVTGDQALLRLGAYRGITLCSPRTFLDVLERRRTRGG